MPDYRSMSRPRYYILEGHDPVTCDLDTWARWFAKSDRMVAKTELYGSLVSTIFLGVDHNFTLKGPALLFETLVFGGPLDQEMDRYSTWGQAEAGHAAMVERVSQASAKVEDRDA